MDGLHVRKIRLRWVEVLTLQAQACTGLADVPDKGLARGYRLPVRPRSFAFRLRTLRAGP